MSEWTSVIAVFWGLWLIDALRLASRPQFTLVGRACGLQGALFFNRLSRPAIWPGGWRLTTTDVPLSLSPLGVCNVPSGVAGEAADIPSLQAWCWEEVAQVGVAHGWIFINGARFCPDTGHVTGPQLLELARMAPGGRDAHVRRLLDQWLRPAHLRRRARRLVRRTAVVAYLNAISFVLLAALSLYLVADGAEQLTESWALRVPQFLLAVSVLLVLIHLTAVGLAWQSQRRLRPVQPEKRGPALLSALLLPPQALRLRSLVGDGFFPAQHPLAVALAFAGETELRRWAFKVLADLRWPLGVGGHPPLVRNVTAWFRSALELRLVSLFAAAGIVMEDLLGPPEPNAPASQLYCPRCRDQFVAGRAECPLGFKLLPLRPEKGTSRAPIAAASSAETLRG